MREEFVKIFFASNPKNEPIINIPLENTNRICSNAANKINRLGYPKKGLKKDSIFGKIQTKYGLEEAN